MLKIRTYFYKLTNWEFWNANFLYIIPTVYLLYLSIKAKSLGFFNATNPSIKNGGFAMESKMDIYNLIPIQYYPKTLFFRSNQNFTDVHTEILKAMLPFPVVIKPDIGLQGLKVAIINSWVELANYLNDVKYDFIIQEYIDYMHEIGIFYCKMPKENSGIITGIVYKEYPTVVGNGVSTINELIKMDLRLLIHWKIINEIYGSKLNTILKLGEKFNLISIGNHARGSKFLDASAWITNKLTYSINQICQQIPDFYFGRIDIKYKSINDLEMGKDFSIIEINGAASLPTHMYDPNHSIFYAWLEIIKHYKIMYKIAIVNHQLGIPYLSFKDVLYMLKEHRNHMNLLK